MIVRQLGQGVLIALVCLGLSATVIAREPPVAKLVQVQGKVEYSRNGTTWKPVRRTKYLFPGYRIKTARDGSGKLINQSTGESQQLGPSSEIKVAGTTIELVDGSLSEPKRESGSIFQGLSNKFAKAQRYTTVRRSVNTGDEATCDSKVRTIRDLTPSPQHPDLVWRNACPEYSYRLVIDEQSFEVPAQATAEMIRFAVSDIKAGAHSYRVEVMDKDGTVYIPNKDSSFKWLSRSEESGVLEKAQQFEADVFVLADFLEQEGMFVAAMDAYREYFSENPDDNDMRPLLIKSYNDLKLSNLKDNEARLYMAQQEEAE